MLRGDESESPGESGGGAWGLERKRLLLRSFSGGESGGLDVTTSCTSSPEAYWGIMQAGDEDDDRRAACPLRSRISVPTTFFRLSGLGWGTRKLPDFFLSSSPSSSVN